MRSHVAPLAFVLVLISTTTSFAQFGSRRYSDSLSCAPDGFSARPQRSPPFRSPFGSSWYRRGSWGSFPLVDFYSGWNAFPTRFINYPVVTVPVAVQPVVVPVNPAPVRPPLVDVGENFARPQPANLQPPVRPIADLPFQAATEIKRRASVLKTSTVQARARADQLISHGDSAFAEQNLGRAVSQYRQAIAKAPDYADAHFRLAHAYVATRRYNLALKSSLVALELSHSAERVGFSLEDMYQGDKFVRERHFARLKDAAKREPEDGGLQFLIGFTQYYDNQRDAGIASIKESAQLDGLHLPYVHLFLPVKPVAEADGNVVAE